MYKDNCISGDMVDQPATAVTTTLTFLVVYEYTIEVCETVTVSVASIAT